MYTARDLTTGEIHEATDLQAVSELQKASGHYEWAVNEVQIAPDLSQPLGGETGDPSALVGILTDAVARAQESAAELVYLVAEGRRELEAFQQEARRILDEARGHGG